MSGLIIVANTDFQLSGQSQAPHYYQMAGNLSSFRAKSTPTLWPVLAPHTDEIRRRSCGLLQIMFSDNTFKRIRVIVIVTTQKPVPQLVPNQETVKMPRLHDN